MVKVPGTLSHSEYNSQERFYRAIFRLSLRYNQPNEAVIFVNQAYYFQNGIDTVIKKYDNGLNISNSNDYLFEKMIVDEFGDYITIFFGSSKIHQNELIEITIRERFDFEHMNMG